MFKVLFVCTGNICRSPTAEGVFRALVDKEGLTGAIEADSAATTDFHVGEPPDQRATQAARRRGVDLSPLRGRQVTPDDFESFDLVLAMDEGHMRILSRMAPEGRADRLRLFLDFAPKAGVKGVPDPYYGGEGGFEYVLDLIEAGSRGLINHIRTQTAA